MTTALPLLRYFFVNSALDGQPLYEKYKSGLMREDRVGTAGIREGSKFKF